MGMVGNSPALTPAIVAVSSLNTLAQRFWGRNMSSRAQVQTMTCNTSPTRLLQRRWASFLPLYRHGRETGWAKTLNSSGHKPAVRDKSRRNARIPMMYFVSRMLARPRFARASSTTYAWPTLASSVVVLIHPLPSESLFLFQTACLRRTLPSPESLST